MSAATLPSAVARRLSRVASRAYASSRRRISSAAPAPRSDTSGARRVTRTMGPTATPGEAITTSGAECTRSMAAFGSCDGVSVTDVACASARSSVVWTSRASAPVARRAERHHDAAERSNDTALRASAVRPCNDNVASARSGRIAWARRAAGRACNPCGSATRSDPVTATPVCAGEAAAAATARSVISASPVRSSVAERRSTIRYRSGSVTMTGVTRLRAPRAMRSRSNRSSGWPALTCCSREPGPRSHRP